MATPSGSDPGSSGPDLVRAARGAGYVLLGLGLLGVQRVQVHRRAVEKQVKERLGPLLEVLPPSLRPR